MRGETLLIRADATVAMGTGHVMRCIALAQAWQDAGGKAVFAMAERLASVRERLLSERIEVVSLESRPGSHDDARGVAELAKRLSAAWVVVDGYHFAAGYQRDLKAEGLRVIAVDDDGSLEHYAADVVLNQNANAHESRYPSREPYTRLLLGFRYVLLRREFRGWRNWKREIPDVGRKILVTMGGTDPDNITAPAIEALRQVKIEGMEARVIVGGSNPHLESLERLSAQCRGSVHLLRDPSNVPDLMAWADLALIIAGGTLWELLFMGCSVLSYARNPVQSQIISHLNDEGIIQALGDPQECNPTRTAAELTDLANSQERRAHYSRLARERIDGGGAQRLVEVLASSRHSAIRPATVTVSTQAVASSDGDAFLAMAERLFRGLNANFVPQADWKQSYFENILGNPRFSLRWIVVDGNRAGFVLFGLEAHRFLPRFNGMIFELYIEPEFRRRGVAQKVAREVIRELQAQSPAKIQLEVMEGNHAAAALWLSLGFRKVSERYVLAETKE